MTPADASEGYNPGVECSCCMEKRQLTDAAAEKLTSEEQRIAEELKEHQAQTYTTLAHIPLTLFVLLAVFASLGHKILLLLPLMKPWRDGYRRSLLPLLRHVNAKMMVACPVCLPRPEQSSRKPLILISLARFGVRTARARCP